MTVFPSAQFLFRPEHDLLVNLAFVEIPGWFEVGLYQEGRQRRASRPQIRIGIKIYCGFG